MLNTFYSSSSSSGFERLATAGALANLRGSIPSIHLESTFDSAALQSSRSSLLLDAYFIHYGFDMVQRYHHDMKYFFGSVEMQSEESYSLAMHVWQSPKPQACVFVAHGLFDHMGLYLQLVHYLLDNSYTVVAMDFPGHGLSSGPIGSIKDFKDYGIAVDLAKDFIVKNKSILLVNDKGRDVPCFAVGQSTGCAALMRYFFLNSEKDSDVQSRSEQLFSRIALVAPLVRPKSWWTVSISYMVFSKFVPSVARNFTKNSHDRKFTKFISKHDPLQPRKISVEWVGSMIRWVKTFPDFDPQDVKVLIVQGTGDGTVDYNYNIPAIKEKFINTEFEFVERAKHHFVNESDAYRLKGFAYIKAFFSS